MQCKTNHKDDCDNPHYRGDFFMFAGKAIKQAETRKAESEAVGN